MAAEANAISDQSIPRWRVAVCELVYIHSKRFAAGMSLGIWRTCVCFWL